MALLTISNAARCCRVARSTLQRAVRAGRLSLAPDHRVDTAELLRVGFTLHDAAPGAQQAQNAALLQDAPSRSSVLPQDAAALEQREMALLRREVALVERERDLLRVALDAAAAREQQHLEREARVLHLLEQMQQRYDRLLEAPRGTPAPLGTRTPGAAGADRGALRRQIVALLRKHPEGLTPAAIRSQLQVEKPLGHTLVAMCRDGLVQRLGPGRYGTA